MLGHASVRRPVVVPITVPILNAHWQSTRKIISRVEKEKENTWSSGRSLMLAYFPFAFVLVVCVTAVLMSRWWKDMAVMSYDWCSEWW